MADVATELLMRARARLRLSQAVPPTPTQPPDATLGSHAMTGVNNAIASVAGFPVNMATMGINALLPKAWEIQNPPGGSEMLRGGMRAIGATTDIAPNTPGERIANRIGEELGAYAIPGLGLVGKLEKPGRAGLSMIAQALTGGGAAALTNEALPGNNLADLVASLLGGGAVVGASHAMRPNPNRPTAEGLGRDVDQAYANVQADTGTINPQSLEEMVGGLRAKAGDMGLHPALTPKADAALGSIEGAYGPQPRGSNYSRTPPTIADIDKERRLINEGVVMSPDPGEARLGRGMRDELDAYLNGLTPADVTGGNPSMTIAELQRARALAQREFKANDVQKAIDSAELSAATTGTGGNTVNRIRQKVKWIIDPQYPNRAKGYSAEEIAAMRKVAEGGAVDNLLRIIANMSPAKGGLNSVLGMGLLSLDATRPLAMAGMATGLAAHGAANAITKNRAMELVDMLRNGGPIAPKAISETEKRTIAALLAANAGGQAQ